MYLLPLRLAIKNLILQKAGARDLFWKRRSRHFHARPREPNEVNGGSMYDTYGNKDQLFIESLQNYARETYSEYKKAAIGENSAFKSIELIMKSRSAQILRLR